MTEQDLITIVNSLITVMMYPWIFLIVLLSFAKLLK